MDFNREQPLQSTVDNHTSALEYKNDIEKDLSTELQHKAIIGLFVQPPFPIHVSPLMTRPKQDSTKRRMIVDCPSIDNITDAFVKLGPGAMIYKVDVNHAFRHIRIDPRDIDLLGLRHTDTFIDITVRILSWFNFFTHCCDTVRHIMCQHGFCGL